MSKSRKKSQAKPRSAIAQQMLNLRPGDVITGLACRDCSNRKILVLAKRGDGYFEFSHRTNDIKIVRDQNGPYRWDDQRAVFRNAHGQAHDHISSKSVVLEGAGLVQLGWYRELKASSAARFFIDPSDLLGTVSEPGVLAKLEALMNRSDEDPAEDVKNTSLAFDLIFSGNETALDERRMRLLHVLVNFIVKKRSRHNIESQVIGFGGDRFGSSLSAFFDSLLGDHPGTRRAGTS